MIKAISKVYGEKESASLYIFSSRSDGGKNNNIGFESSSIYPNIQRCVYNYDPVRITRAFGEIQSVC
jgi:hypothetical protein